MYGNYIDIYIQLPTDYNINRSVLLADVLRIFNWEGGDGEF